MPTFRSQENDRFLALSFLLMTALFVPPRAQAQSPATPSSRVLGTVQSVDGKSVRVLSDSGVTSAVSLEDSTKLLQIEPGQTDLKEARPLSLADLQPGDRVLVRGVLADDGKTIRAASVIAMKKAALSQKLAQETAEWQHGVGGLVQSVDPEAGTIRLATNGLSANKDVIVHLSKRTVLRRYAADSIRFDAAALAPLAALHAGDQLRARGTRSADGLNFEAAEIISGTFRNIAGIVRSVDSQSSTIVIQDLASKADVRLRVTGESRMRKLPEALAEHLAARIKSQAPDGAAELPPSSQSAAESPSSSPSRAPSGGRGPSGNGGDFQQVIARMPAAALSDLQKNDAVMVVTTEGNGTDPLTVITLLAGVEPILRASPRSGREMILSPWSLGEGEPSVN